MKSTKLALIILICLIIGQGGVYAQGNGEPYVIGMLNMWISPGFAEELAALGYVEGENLITMPYTYIPVTEEMPYEAVMEEYARQRQAMIDAGADVFITNTDTDAVNARPLVGDAPILFGRSDDPVATGAVEDLVAPGATLMTGGITNRPHERRVQILTEINPETDRIYYLYSTLTGEAETVLQQVRAVAEDLNIEVIPAATDDLAMGLEALQNIPEGADWLFLTPYVPYDAEFTETLVATSLSAGVPISGFMLAENQGYLMGYGPDIDASDRQLARMVDRIFRGADPALLPVETIENALMINLETAEMLNMEIPQSILRQADLIIRPGHFDEQNSGS